MSYMLRLASYIENQSVGFPLSQEYAALEGATLGKAFEKVFTDVPNDNDGHTFRSSAIGKHPFLTAWGYFHEREEAAITFSTRFKFLTGYAFEAAFNVLLRQLEIPFESQRTIAFTLPNFTISGHPDYIVQDGENKWILETKCTNDTTFRQWKKKGEVDRPEYNVQLSMYCLREQAHGAFVVANVDTGELALYPMSYQSIVDKFKERVITALANLNFIVGCSEWWRTLERIAPPNCPQRKDGTYYFNVGLYKGKGQLHPAAEIFNYTQRDDGTFEVHGFNYPSSAIQWQPECL